VGVRQQNFAQTRCGTPISLATTYMRSMRDTTFSLKNRQSCITVWTSTCFSDGPTTMSSPSDSCTRVGFLQRRESTPLFEHLPPFATGTPGQIYDSTWRVVAKRTTWTA